MADPVKCPACGRLVSNELEACPYCREDLPSTLMLAAEAARTPEPVKCGDCGRLASPSFAACPFCGAAFAVASGAAPGRARPISVAPPRPLPRNDDDDHDVHDSDLHDAHVSPAGSVVAFGLLAGAGLGVWSYWRYDTLVAGGQGLGRAAFVVALGVGAYAAQMLLRRYEEEPLAETAARIGWSRVLLRCAFVTMALAIPGALTIYGVAMAVNASGTAQTREEVTCVAPTVFRVRATTLKSRGAAYAVRYTCELRDGIEARGQLALHDEPRVRSGGTMSLVASRGLLGIWLRWGGIVPGSEAGGARALETQPE